MAIPATMSPPSPNGTFSSYAHHDVLAGIVLRGRADQGPVFQTHGTKRSQEDSCIRRLHCGGCGSGVSQSTAMRTRMKSNVSRIAARSAISIGYRAGVAKARATSRAIATQNTIHNRRALRRRQRGLIRHVPQRCAEQTRSPSMRPPRRVGRFGRRGRSAGRVRRCRCW